MSARLLAEGASNLICDYIRSNISSALSAVASGVTVPKMSLENPAAYYVYEKAKGYQSPSVFVILDEMDFQIPDNKSNFINARDKVNVSIVVEDQDEEILTYKAWRYQSALHSVLDEATMINSGNTLVLKCVVYRASFSPLYKDEDGQGGFKKEVVLHCEVTHLENF